MTEKAQQADQSRLMPLRRLVIDASNHLRMRQENDAVEQAVVVAISEPNRIPGIGIAAQQHRVSPRFKSRLSLLQRCQASPAASSKIAGRAERGPVIQAPPKCGAFA